MAVLYPTSGMYITAKNGMDPRLRRGGMPGLQQLAIRLHLGRQTHSECLARPQYRPMTWKRGWSRHGGPWRNWASSHYFSGPNMYNGRPWHDPYYDPLWTAAQDLAVPIGFHETTGSRMPATGADRFPDDLGIAHIATHSIEQMMACMDVIMAGVMGAVSPAPIRFPGRPVWLAAVLAGPDGRPLRVAQPVRRDAALNHKAF